SREGKEYTQGIELLQQLVMAKAFPKLAASERLKYVEQVFDHQDTLVRLCRISGGHIRNLLGMLYRCIQEQDPPIAQSTLESIIRESRDRLLLAIDDREWQLLFQVVNEQKVKGEAEYQVLLRSMFVFEYRDEKGNWFGLNPLLLEADKYRVWQKQQEVIK
ncbi:MAG: ATP-binding protein, partial [Okeania sp. SIO2D1]|nr:ATP-binding protein [Okeania sp. SIO2D1]